MTLPLNFDRLFDVNLQLKDSGSAVTADALATVGGSTATIDVGSGAFLDAALVVDVSAMDVASTDESYKLRLIGSNSSSFASGIAVLATLELGVAASMSGGAGASDANKTTGRWIVPFHNLAGTTIYQYLRLALDVGGTTPSITYTAFIAKDD